MLNYDKAVATAMGASMSPKRVYEFAKNYLDQMKRLSLADQRAVLDKMNELLGEKVERAMNEALQPFIGKVLDGETLKEVKSLAIEKLLEANR